MNTVTLSDDRMWMTIHGDGRQVRVHSSRQEGFTEEDVVNARRFNFPKQPILPGEKRRVVKRRIVGRTWYLHVNTGPPTWWMPRIIAGRRDDGAVEFGAGWLRGMVAVSVK